MNNSFTHNLKILIIDNDDNIIENEELLNKIYIELADIQISREGKWFNKKMIFFLLWQKKLITEIEEKFIGDLFTSSIYSDELLYKITEYIIKEIEIKIKNTIDDKNWKIIFHISKFLENRNECYNQELIIY